MHRDKGGRWRGGVAPVPFVEGGPNSGQGERDITDPHCLLPHVLCLQVGKNTGTGAERMRLSSRIWKESREEERRLFCPIVSACVRVCVRVSVCVCVCCSDGGTVMKIMHFFSN